MKKKTIILTTVFVAALAAVSIVMQGNYNKLAKETFNDRLGIDVPHYTYIEKVSDTAPDGARESWVRVAFSKKAAKAFKEELETAKDWHNLPSDTGHEDILEEQVEIDYTLMKKLPNEIYDGKWYYIDRSNGGAMAFTYGLFDYEGCQLYIYDIDT